MLCSNARWIARVNQGRKVCKGAEDGPVNYVYGGNSALIFPKFCFVFVILYIYRAISKSETHDGTIYMLEPCHRRETIMAHPL